MATRLPDAQPAETLARRPPDAATDSAKRQSKRPVSNYQDRLLGEIDGLGLGLIRPALEIVVYRSQGGFLDGVSTKFLAFCQRRFSVGGLGVYQSARLAVRGGLIGRADREDRSSRGLEASAHLLQRTHPVGDRLDI